MTASAEDDEPIMTDSQPSELDGVALICIDGSELSLQAVGTGLAVVTTGLTPVLVMASETTDPGLLTGTGHSGSTITGKEYDEIEDARKTYADDALRDAAATLGLGEVRTARIDGRAGHAICRMAEEESATVIVIGSRGHGGFRRAVLGSVSDHVVRHAPCPVVVTTIHED